MFDSAEYHKQWYQKNKPRIAKQAKQYRMENPQKVKETQARSYQKHREERCKYNKEYYEQNKEKIKARQRNYHRKYALSTGRGRKVIRGLNKRDWMGYCELCGDKKKLLSYHHWDKKNFNKGLWVCYNCHQICEAIDKKLSLMQRYISLKKFLNKEERKNAKAFEVCSV